MAWELLGVREERTTGDILDTSQGLAIDKEDNVYVVDKFSNRIQKFDSEGRFLAFLPKDTLSSPEGITIDDGGSLYVTDNKAGLVEKYDHEGNLVDSIKSYRTGNEKSVSIIGIAVSRSGNLYISDLRNHNIQKFEQSSYMPNLQLFVNDLDLAFTNLFEEQSARMRLMPDSVNGIRVNSGQNVNELGVQAVIGRMPAGDTGKVVVFTIQNHDFRLEHKVRVQLGFLDKDRIFVVRHDSLVTLN